MSTRMRRVIAKSLGLGLLAILSLAFSITSFAQSDNTQISGFVKDQAGGVVAGAKVTIKSETKSLERAATTNAEGYFVITTLPPDLYSVTVEANGFKQYQEKGRKLDPNLPASIEIALQPGQVTETVTVTASVAQVQTESSTVGKLVDVQQVEKLQLNGRNPLFLALLKPGVAGGALGGFSAELTSGGFNINGSRSQDNLITFDGAVAIRTRSNGTSIGVADLDSTQEIQILTANYNAEYGRSSGGQIRIVTKSGSRDFHGNVYEYHRNSALNANSWGRNAATPANQPCSDPLFEKANHCRPEPFRFNQFGYNLGGPVIIPGTGFNRDRNKLFWLWGQEWFKFNREQTTNIRVPTARMRNGDFSELLPGGPNYVPQLAVNRFIKDPLKSGACSASDTSGCFSDGGIINKIPANRLSPNGLALMRALPDPLSGYFGPGGQNYFQSRAANRSQLKNTISVDFYPTEKHQLRFRIQLYDGTFPDAFRGGTDRAPATLARPNQTATINWVWTVSPTWIAETVIAGSRDQVFITVQTEGDRFRRSKYGINYPYLFQEKEIFDKIPTVEWPDFNGLDGGPYPAQSTGPIYQINQNWTNIRGNHTIKFGGYFERAGQNDFDQINVAGVPGGTNNQNGRFVFTNGTPGGTGVGIANAAIGLFDTYAELGSRAFTPYRGHMFEWFVQDSWKATPKLRLELGVRHTIIQPYYSLWRNQLVFDEKYYNPNNVVTQNPANGLITGGNLQARYNGLVIPGDGFTAAANGRFPLANDQTFGFLFRGEPKSYSNIHVGNTFQPRIGFAYAFSDKSVIRGGAGRFLTRLGVSDSVFLGGNPPFQPTGSVSFGSVDRPGGSAGIAFPLTITTQDRNFRSPEAWTWNLTFEREIGFNTTLEVGYVGRRGLFAQRERNLNQLPVGTLFRPENRNAQGQLLFNVDTLRPYKGLAVIRTTGNEANSLYNGLQIGLTRRFASGFSFGGAYTLSKTYDSGSAQREVVPNAYDTSNLWGPAGYDRRHVAVLNVIYELPIFRDRSKLSGKLLGGWTITAVSQMQTGTPFSIGTGDDFAGVGTGSGAQFWRVNGDPKLDDQKFAVLRTSDANYWFRIANPDGTPIFTRPANGTIVTDRVRNIIHGPGFQNHNLGLHKDFIIKESHRFTFRLEAFNWLNHPDWSGPDTNPNNVVLDSSGKVDPARSTFGKISGKGGNRELQFALRYQF
ncbi:MAG: Plug and carboxypeptidase regulatory-like domain-containing protein [Acidobacteria bacterium]|nr:Plug and carboxypeptidase regulatory-like domain-containing protein [Acidobacteriota bacterium]